MNDGPNHEFVDCWSGRMQDGMKLLRRVGAVLDSHHLRWFIYGGTLLGHVRHGGFIPWDDDIDIALLLDDPPALSETKRMEQVWNTLHEVGFDLAANDCQAVYQLPTKIYDVLGSSIPQKPYAWPFVDVFGAWDVGDGAVRFQGVSTPRVDMVIERMLPLRQANFLGIPVAIPMDAENHCDAYYGADWRTHAVSPTWNHRKACPVGGSIKMPLSDLGFTMQGDGRWTR